MEVRDDALDGPPLLDELWPLLRATAQPSVRLSRSTRCDPTSTSSRLGGLPLLTPDTDWPRSLTGEPLSLVGVWNTNEINAWHGTSVVPVDQVLSFFYDAVEQRGWGYDPADTQFWRVIAAAEPDAVAVAAPDGAETFPSWSLTPKRVLTVPDRFDPAVEDLTRRDRDGVRDAYDRLETSDPPPRHRAFGWPEPVQNAMPLECQLASNGVYVGGPEGYRDPRVAGLKAGAADWRLLWQIDTDEDAGWMWGDVGTIYYWIREQDLVAGRFDKVWMIFQCC
jgi:uncharacterized protein YwqG